MSDRTRSWLLAAWAAFVVAVLALNVVAPLPGQQASWPWATGLMAFPVAGAVVLARRPGNAIGRIFAGIGLAAAIIFTTTWYVLVYPQAPLSRITEVLSTVAAVAQFGGLLALLHLFPTGRTLGPRHRMMLLALAGWVVAMAALSAVRPGPMDLTGRPNPLGIAPLWTRAVFDAGVGGLLLFTVAGIVALVVRRRRAGAVERAQLKWFFAGAGAVLVMMVVVAVVPQGSPLDEAIGGVLVVVGFWSLPAATVVAITRYRLYEIDRVISRTVAYTIVAAVVALVYAGSVVGLQAVLPVGGSNLAVAASTLAAAATFTPVLRRVQRLLERRFNRSRYEARLVTQQLAERLRRQEALELHAVTSDLVEVVRATMQPASVALWLRGGGR